MGLRAAAEKILKEAKRIGIGHRSTTTTFDTGLSPTGQALTHGEFEAGAQAQMDREHEQATSDASAAKVATETSLFWSQKKKKTNTDNATRADAATQKLGELQHGTLPPRAISTIRTMHPNWTTDQVMEEVARIARFGANQPK